MSQRVQEAVEPQAERAAGVLPSQAIARLVAGGAVQAASAIAPEQVQPASLDLRLGNEAFRVRASFLPGSKKQVADKLRDFTMHRIDLTDGAVLERGCVYVIPLQESLRLDGELSAFANPKSSTGRLDVFTRLTTDQGKEFDRVRPGYAGPLYLEVVPRTFSILVRAGSRLNQIRFRRGSPGFDAESLRRLHAQVGLVDSRAGTATIRDDSIGVTLDLQGDPQTGLVGFRARRHSGVVDVDKVAHYEAADFWEPITTQRRKGLILNPDDFYILATKEAVTVPPDHSAEMLAYDTFVGEFRVHYAGFFDPGFGHDPGGTGSRAVLEVRSHDVPFLLEHEQIVGWLRYEPLTEAPERLYGAGIGSSYQGQGLTLSKPFKPWR